MFDRQIYFDQVRKAPFGGTMNQGQVDGQETILGGFEGSGPRDVRHLGYMLATTYHETATTMQPIKEYGGESYLKSKPYYPFYGRGFVQLTWEDNYRRATDELGLKAQGVDLVKTPDKALDPDIAYAVMDRGMSEGWFRGDSKGRQTLARYFSDTVNDPVNARDIINGDVKTMGPKIAGYHQSFVTALEASSVEDDGEVVVSIESGAIHVSVKAPRSSVRIDGQPL